MHEIEKAETIESIRACYPVMHQLRPDLSEEEFLRRVQLQRERQEYHLIYITREGAVVAAAGYRFTDNLHMGRHLYVDDLVTCESARRIGCGRALLDWMEAEARRHGLASLHLDSGVQRHPAHRLYIGAGMDIMYYHFRKMLAD